MNRSAQVQAGEHLVIAVIDGDAMRWARELHCHPQPGDIPAANGRADVEVLVQLRANTGTRFGAAPPAGHVVLIEPLA